MGRARRNLKPCLLKKLDGTLEKHKQEDKSPERNSALGGLQSPREKEPLEKMGGLRTLTMRIGLVITTEVTTRS